MLNPSNDYSVSINLIRSSQGFTTSLVARLKTLESASSYDRMIGRAFGQCVPALRLPEMLDLSRACVVRRPGPPCNSPAKRTNSDQNFGGLDYCRPPCAFFADQLLDRATIANEGRQLDSVSKKKLRPKSQKKLREQGARYGSKVTVMVLGLIFGFSSQYGSKVPVTVLKPIFGFSTHYGSKVPVTVLEPIFGFSAYYGSKVSVTILELIFGFNAHYVSKVRVMVLKLIFVFSTHYGSKVPVMVLKPIFGFNAHYGSKVPVTVLEPIFGFNAHYGSKVPVMVLEPIFGFSAHYKSKVPVYFPVYRALE
nr:probable inactive protein kinase DDB_G0270444 isoform X2 [Ipomoea trifida]